MTGDFSRNSQDPTKSYTGVLMQQGRVQVDADWNEQLALAQHRTDIQTIDVIGESGTPMGEDGFGISLTPTNDDFFIHPGRYYIGGLLCEIDPEWISVSLTVTGTTGKATLSSSWLDGRPISQFDWVEIHSPAGSTYARVADVPQPTTNKAAEPVELSLENIKTGFPGPKATRLRRALTYLTQPFYPSPDFAPGVSSPPLEAPGLGLILDGGNYVVYLEGWQRSANALEDPHIREVALDGPDTAERIQTVWQVRLLPVAAGKNLCQAHLSEWKSLLAENTTTAQMNAQAAPPPQNTNKCMLPPSAGFQGLQNQLYRIEILHGGSESEATYIWSRDNGMVETSIVSVNTTTPNVVTVNSLGTDDLHSFSINDWVEIVDRDDELSGTKRFLAQIVAPAPDPVSKQITLSASVPQPYLDAINEPPIPTTNHYRLKRWDMSGTGVTADGIQTKPNTWMPIEEGVEVWFGDGHYAERAWWLIPARTATADIEWPPFQVPNTEPIPQPPSGINRSFCRIGTIDSEVSPWIFGDCRNFFPPLTALEGLYYVGGDGQEAMPGQPLPEPLQVRVANGGWPVKGVQVQFAFDKANKSGVFTSGSPDPDTSTAVTVTTDKDGIAKCTWTLPGNWTPVSPTVPPSSPPPAYQVIATVVDPALQDSNGNSIYMPVVFSAEWSTADQVAFAPSGCITLGSCTTVQEALDTLCPPGLYYVGGDGQDARPGKQVPLPLQVSVATGSSHLTANQADVTFAVVAPSTALLSATHGVTGTSGSIQIPTDANGIASCYWTPDNLTPNQQVMATLNGSTASPVCFNVNYDPGVHITNIQYRKTPYREAASLVNLTNNEVIPAYYFANNPELQIACDNSLNLATITRGSCFLTLDWFYQYQYYGQFDSFGRGGAILPGTFLPLILDASLTLSSDKKTILWQPTAPAQQLIGEMTAELSVLAYPPRVLARLAIKGNMILSDAAIPLHLDGNAFFDASGVRPDPLSGDGSRGGTYDTYFWLAWDVLLTFPSGQITSPTDPVLAPWAANTKYALNDIVLDSHGNLEQVTVAGTSGATAPPWPTTFTGGATVDGATKLTWQQTSPNYSLSFSQSAVKVTQMILVTNAGSAAVTVRGELVFGSTKIWGVTDAINLPAGESSALVVTYSPQIGATGAAANGIMVISTSDPSAPSVSVGLSGTPATTQAVPALAISPTTLSFESQKVGTTSGAKTITLTAETAAVSIGSVEIFGPTSADFSFQTGCSTLAAAAKCSINVTFTPSQTGQGAGLLIINDNAGGSPQTVLLVGTGS
jgi:hypothetical protein